MSCAPSSTLEQRACQHRATHATSGLPLLAVNGQSDAVTAPGAKTSDIVREAGRSSTMRATGRNRRLRWPHRTFFAPLAGIRRPAAICRRGNGDGDSRHTCLVIGRLRHDPDDRPAAHRHRAVPPDQRRPVCGGPGLGRHAARPNCLYRHDLPHQHLANRAGALFSHRPVPHKLLEGSARLADKREEAQIVVEMRSGGVGIDRLEFLLGIPSLGLSQLAGSRRRQAAPLITPELAILKSTRQYSFASVAFVAYWADTGELLTSSGPFVGKTVPRGLVDLRHRPRTVGDIPPTERRTARSGGWRPGVAQWFANRRQSPKAASPPPRPARRTCRRPPHPHENGPSRAAAAGRRRLRLGHRRCCSWS